MPKLKRYWKALQKKEKQGDEEAMERAARDKTFLASLIEQFLHVLDSIPAKGEGCVELKGYCIYIQNMYCIYVN